MTIPEETPFWQPGEPKLLERVRNRCRLRHLALSTEHAYAGWIRRFILFHNKRHPLQMGAVEFSAFLTHLRLPFKGRYLDFWSRLIASIRVRPTSRQS